MMKKLMIGTAIASASLFSVGAVAQSTAPQSTAPNTPSSSSMGMDHRESPSAPAAGMPSPAAGMGMHAQPRTSLDHADVSFLKDAVQSDDTEIAASRLALEKSKNDDVRKFAQTMIDAHTQTRRKAMDLGQQKGVKMPERAGMLDRAKMKLLSAYDGANFDRHYVDSIGVSAHKDAVELFRKTSARAKDADVKSFATDTLPTLTRHLEMANQLQMEVDGKSARND